MAEGKLLLLLKWRSFTRVTDHPTLCLYFTFTLLGSIAGITGGTFASSSINLSDDGIGQQPWDLLSSNVSKDQILSSLVSYLWSNSSNHTSTFEDDLADFVTKYQQQSDNVPTPIPDQKPNPSVSVSVSTSTRIFTRSSSTSSSSSNTRKRNRQQTGFQDIISGLVKLLGGKNVHVANHSAEADAANGPHAIVPSRTNNRAPPKFTLVTSSTPSAEASTATGDRTQLSASFSTNLESFTSTSDSDTAALPTGEITEWIPAYKQSSTTSEPHATGSPASLSTSTSKLSTSSTKLDTYTTTTQAHKSKISATRTQSWSSTTTETQTWTSTIQTEVDYADKTTSKTSFSAIRPSTTTKSRSTTQFSAPPVTSKPVPKSESAATSAETSSVLTATLLPTLNIKPTQVPSSSSTTVGLTGSPFIIPVDIEQIRLMGSSENDPPQQSGQSVYIDGRKTYFDLNPVQTKTAEGRPGGDSTLVNVGIGYSFPVANAENANNRGSSQGSVHQGSVSNVQVKQPSWPTPQRPAQTPPKTVSNGRPLVISKNQVRIDTCIIGDETACNGELNETCRVEAGVSSCYCKLGFGRNDLQQQQSGCQPVVSVVVYLRVDRVNTEALVFGPEYQNPSSDKYQILESEAKIALDSAFQMSSLANDYSSSIVNSFFSVGTKLIVNATVHLLARRQEVADVPRQIRQSLIKILQQRQQAIGQSRLFVDGPLNPIPGVQDLDECADELLNDCSKFANCANTFGSFSCECFKGYIDKYPDDPAKSGRNCAVCSSAYCSNRGDCIISAAGDKECRCHGNFIGAKCETDAEVLGVALGASLAALVIIVLTLVCLCMWSRRWKRDQQKMLNIGNNFNYNNKPSGNNFNDRSNLSCSPDYHHSAAASDHLRWTSNSSDIIHDNYYAKPELLMVKQQTGYPMSRPPPLPSCPPPSALQPGLSKHGSHKMLQPLRSLPSPVTNSRSNIMEDTDEEYDNFTTGVNYDRFQFSQPKSNRMAVNPMNNIYYDVNFGNNFGGVGVGPGQHEFPMKNMRPFYS